MNTETPEQIAEKCFLQYCTPDEYEGRVKKAIAAALRAKDERIACFTDLLKEERKLSEVALVDLQHAQTRIAELEKALEPFAACATHDWIRSLPDGGVTFQLHGTTEKPYRNDFITAGNIRHAADLLSQTTKQTSK